MNVLSTQPDDVIKLRHPQAAGGMGLHDVLSRRRSCREFSEQVLTDQELAQLCWSGQGITHEEGLRVAPSAGALYSVTLLLATADGLFEYLPEKHALRMLLNVDVRGRLQAAALDQDCVGTAPACLILAMNVRRMAHKYGDRAKQYCLLEAGHAAQNILLEATALGLGSVPVGAFEDRQVSAILKLSRDWEPVYLVPVGHPR